MDPLGIVFKNENVKKDMLAFLEQFHTYLPQSNDSDIDGQLFTKEGICIKKIHLQTDWFAPPIGPIFLLFCTTNMVDGDVMYKRS